MPAASGTPSSRRDRPRGSGAPSPITQHRFTSPAALLESIVDDLAPSETSVILQCLARMDAKPADPEELPETAQGGLPLPDFVMWLGLVSSVGRLAHGMLDVLGAAR